MMFVIFFRAQYSDLLIDYNKNKNHHFGGFYLFNNSFFVIGF